MSTPSVAEQLIADIRRRSGLNQADLARRAGLTGSVLSAYARGRRQPGVEALARIAAAAGLEIRVGEAGDPVGLEQPVEGPSDATQSPAAASLAQTKRAWARGGAEGKQLDRIRARGMSPDQRIDEGLALVRIAGRLQAGRGAR
jgi:uncharacterized protein